MSASTAPATPRSMMLPNRGSNVLAQSRRFLKLLWLEVRRSQGYWLLPIMIGLGIYAPSSDVRDNAPLWVNATRCVLESSMLLAIFAAALAAWLVGREARRKALDLGATLPGSGTMRDLLTTATAACWGLAAYAGVAAWFFAKAILENAWGRPDLGLITVGALGIVVLTLLGTLIGKLVPGRFAPIAALIFGWLLVLGLETWTTSDGFTRPLRLLSPMGIASRDGEVDGLFVRWNDSLVGESTRWLLALILMLGLALAVWRSRHLGTAGALALAVVIAAMAARPLIQAEGHTNGGAFGGQAHAVEYTPVCGEAGEIRVCVHPGYAQYLDATVASVDAVLSPVAGLPGVPTSVIQRGSITLESVPGELGINSVGHADSRFELLSNLFQTTGEQWNNQYSASQIVILAWLAERGGTDFHGMSGLEWFGMPVEVPQVWQESGNMAGPAPADTAQYQQVFADMETALARFSALSPDEQRAWLEANWDALRAGEIPLEDMP